MKGPYRVHDGRGDGTSDQVRVDSTHDGPIAVFAASERGVNLATQVAEALNQRDAHPTSERDVSVLRAHAIAAALLRCRPAERFGDARVTWSDCVRQLARVVCSDEGVSVPSFYGLCGTSY
jgi:hypothetical protein